jgi:hypothetical protein
MTAALQLGLIGYAVGCITVNIATFDLFYHYLAVIVMCTMVGNRILERQEIPGARAQSGESAKPVSKKWAPPKPHHKAARSTG